MNVYALKYPWTSVTPVAVPHDKPIRIRLISIDGYRSDINFKKEDWEFLVEQIFHFNDPCGKIKDDKYMRFKHENSDTYIDDKLNLWSKKKLDSMLLKV